MTAPAARDTAARVRGAPARALVAAALLGAAAPLAAQARPAPPPAATEAQLPEFPQLSLSASAAREVPQDRVSVTLGASREAPGPADAQAQVNEVLNRVLKRLKARSDLEVQSGAYRSDPVWQESRIVAWRTHGTLQLTAAPSEAFDALVGELANELEVQSIAHFLSREARLEAERTLIDEAVAAFRARAQASAEALGFGGWAVRSVAIDGSDPPPPQPRFMMARAAAAEAAPMPMAEGRTTVIVTVSGTVVLRER